VAVHCCMRAVIFRRGHITVSSEHTHSLSSKSKIHRRNSDVQTGAMTLLQCCSVLYLHIITGTTLAPSRLLLYVSVTRATLSLSHAHVSDSGESVRTAGNWSKLLRTQHNASFSLCAL
jgi:hypothetical protein